MLHSDRATQLFVQFSILITVISSIWCQGNNTGNATFPIENLAMCFDGLPNTVVTVADGSTYIMKANSYWKMTGDYKAVGPPLPLSDWPNFPAYPDLGFTVWGSKADWNSLTGRTLIAKNGIWYQYHNKVFEQQGNNTFWYDNKYRMKNNVSNEVYDKVMTQLNDSVVQVKGYNLLDARPTGYVFDDFFLPDHLQSFNVILSVFSQKIQFLMNAATAFYLVPTTNGQYLLFLEHRLAGSYCIINSLNTSANCNLKAVDLLFNCPPAFYRLKDDNWLAIIYYSFGISINVLLVCMVGAQIGILGTVLIQNALVSRKIGILWRYHNK